MATDRWEYQQLYVTRIRQKGSWTVRVFLVRGREQKLLWEGDQSDDSRPSTNELMDQYGNDGWELVGSPVQETLLSREPDIDAPDRWTDFGRWASVSYWMKRRVT